MSIYGIIHKTWHPNTLAFSPKTDILYFQNAVVALNELRPGLEYRLVEQKGPTHLPTFVMQIEVNGQIFKAEGR